MWIGCTRKVAKEMKQKMTDITTLPNEFYCWHVMQFDIYDDTILLFMNLETRFPIFMHHMNFESYAHIEEQFANLFRETMSYLHVPLAAVDAYLKIGSCTWCKTWDRSILSQMSDLAYIYKSNIRYGAHHFYKDVDASIAYASIPCVKACIYPKKNMYQWMMNLYGQTKRVL